MLRTGNTSIWPCVFAAAIGCAALELECHAHEGGKLAVVASEHIFKFAGECHYVGYGIFGTRTEVSTETGVGPRVEIPVRHEYTAQRVNAETIGDIEYIMQVDVNIPSGYVVLAEVVVERRFKPQLVGEAYLHTCAETYLVGLGTVGQLDADPDVAAVGASDAECANYAHQ